MAQSAPSPSKNRQLHPYNLSSMVNGEESKEMTERSLYFDILPVNAISNVVRFLSESPRAEKWAYFIDLVDVSSLYDVKGELGAFTLTLCTALGLGVKSSTSFSLLKGEPKEAIGCKKRSLLDISVPECVAESFSALFVRDAASIAKVRKHGDFISEKFLNIRQLVLYVEDGAERVWILKLGVNIESLRCNMFYIDIAKYCPDLRHLYLNRLNLYKHSVKSWKKIGEKLETLEVHRFMDTVEVIELVEKFCRKIKRLELSGQNDAVDEAISKCIVSYGNQLEWVRLNSLTEKQLLRVKTACPKAEIKLFSDGGALAQTVKIVGNELKETSVTFMPQQLEREEDSVDWSACANIEKSEFYHRVTVADVESFFKSPKYHLKLFHLSIQGGIKKARAAISLIAKGTGGLKEFWFSCKDASIGMFTELVDSNRSMHNVEILLRDSARKNEVATDIVKTFLKSPSLKNLEVSGPHMQWRDSAKIPEIERICRIEGCRRVCISVFRVCYLR